MATKTKAHSLTGAAHTAGIFADLSVDGPIIGTLVAIVDRAKNLPNRKTIGKQDPYCAARLGKEAKKTATDIRGGQTPKWDQELRFTVHDSSDYYQLKVSVFTDDKKTDLIGETWIDLKSIIISGGGQGDVWQTLTCRGKYAGEIRIEITFYDSRPKPAPKPRQSIAPNDAQESVKQRTPMKRRPLPSDPVTGESPQAPSVHSPGSLEHHQTPPRQHAKRPSQAQIPAQSPLQSLEYARQPGPPRQHSEPMPQHASHHDEYRQQDVYEMDPRVIHQDERNSMPDLRHSLPPDDGPPPPPPAHRSRGNTNSHDVSPNKMRQEVLRSEAHRSSMSSAPSYPGQPTYRPFESAPQNHQTYQPPGAHDSMAARHHSHDGVMHDAHYHTPTVEDVPDSPTGSMALRQQSRRPVVDELTFGGSPAPLNAGRSPGHSSYRGSPAHAPTYDHGYDQSEPSPYDYAQHSAPVSPMASRDLVSTSPGRDPYGGQGQYNTRREPEPRYQHTDNYDLPALPSSLVPGVDPGLAQQVQERVYDERQDPRYPPRGRQQSEPPMQYGDAGHSPQHHHRYTHDRRQTVDYNNSHDYGHSPPRQQRHSVSPAPPTRQQRQSASPAPMAHHARHSVSPNPNHRISRKSVSPAPPMIEERGSSSSIPWGPDSYDGFNPAVSSLGGSAISDGSNVSGSSERIITHDGKEIDPSDHLPMDTWAPEPEPKMPSGVESRSRPVPGGAQPMPASTRSRQPRNSRQQALPPASSAGYVFSSDSSPAPGPGPASANGRNRLQKRGHRDSAPPPPAGPLATIERDNYQRPQNHQQPAHYHTMPAQRLPRAKTWDYPSENHAPAQQHGYDPRTGYGPPKPPKVPLMSGGNGMVDDRLAEEMQSIDIGAGRSRRRGGY